MWKVFGNGAETMVVEANDGTLSYEDARWRARMQLNDCMGPIAVRLAEIERDEDKEKWKKPEYNAWVRDFGKTILVTAKTKKRAAEIMGYGRTSFDNSFTRCDGHWWYEYAREEGKWNKASDDFFDQTYEKVS